MSLLLPLCLVEDLVDTLLPTTGPGPVSSRFSQSRVATFCPSFAVTRATLGAPLGGQLGTAFPRVVPSGALSLSAALGFYMIQDIT